MKGETSPKVFGGGGGGLEQGRNKRKTKRNREQTEGKKAEAWTTGGEE